jgi:hypothetical protein
MSKVLERSRYGLVELFVMHYIPTAELSTFGVTSVKNKCDLPASWTR